MSNDKKLKLLQYLYFFPAMLCMMLFINADVSSSPYAKLLGTILAPLQLLCLLLLEFEDTYKNEKSS